MMMVLAGNSVRAAVEPPAAARTNSPTFAVRGYEVVGNTVLPPATIEATLRDFTGPAVDLARVRLALGELQLAYRKRGFATVGLALPPQQLTNGIVKIQATEGRLVDINVIGNKYYSTNNIRRVLPSLTTNVLLNTRWFQPELDQANSNPDRQIYPVISPGPDPGTTALTLQVKDRLPLHGRFEADNRSTPGTPWLRLDSSLQYNNLWQLEHQVGVQYTFSPQAMKQGDEFVEWFGDRPLVASYSGFYRIPLHFGSGLRQTYDELPVDFGYDEVTRTFRAPPSTGNPDLIVYASRSTSEMPVRYGPLTTITNTVMADITSQFAQREVTLNDDIGTRFSLPLPEFGGVRSSATFGIDFKNYKVANFSTNYTYFDLYSLDEFNNRVLVTNKVIALDSASQQSVYYYPLSIGWSASRPDRGGSTAFSVSQNLYLAGLASPRKDFEEIAGSFHAGGTYTTLSASLVRNQRLGGGWSLLFRANGQWASEPLISNEQFGLGGSSGVRGYEEGQNYGDSGWRTLLDLRPPPFTIGELSGWNADLPVNLRPSIFIDYGEVYLKDPGPYRVGTVRQCGTGVGVLANVGPNLETRLTVAWALLDTPATYAGQLRAYFSVALQF